MDLSAYGIKSPLRALYESALQGYVPQIADQVRSMAAEQGEVDEAQVAFLTQRFVHSLLLSDDDSLAAFFGDSIPEELRPAPFDHQAHWLFHLDGLPQTH